MLTPEVTYEHVVAALASDAADRARRSTGNRCFIVDSPRDASIPRVSYEGLYLTLSVAV